MKTTILMISCIFCMASTQAQNLKIQTGGSFSKLDWSGTDIYGNRQTGFTAFIGIDYLEKQYFNLSTNIGYVPKGGKASVTFSDAEGNNLPYLQTITLDYLSLNTTFDLKYPIKEKYVPFVSIGPRIDYLLSFNNALDFHEENHLDIDKLNYGAILGGGFKFLFEAFSLGIRADYYLDAGQVAEWKQTNTLQLDPVKDQTFTATISFGYQL